jgi:hypothetical protein
VVWQYPLTVSIDEGTISLRVRLSTERQRGRARAWLADAGYYVRLGEASLAGASPARLTYGCQGKMIFGEL